MAAEKTKLIKTIDKFIKETNKRFAIKRVVLFGSFVDGRYKKYSDIDLALVSKNFTGNRFLDKDKIRKYIVAVNTDISPMPFRPEDFTTDDFFVEEILKYGIRIQ